MTSHIAPSSVWSLVRGRGGHWCPKRLTNDAYKTLFQLKEYHLLQVTFYYYLTVHSSSCSWEILCDLHRKQQDQNQSESEAVNLHVYH